MAKLVTDRNRVKPGQVTIVTGAEVKLETLGHYWLRPFAAQTTGQKGKRMYFFGSVTDTIVRTNHSWDMEVMTHGVHQVSVIENFVQVWL